MSLANYIRDDLRAWIADPRREPPKLSLKGLSAHYRVSLTPVRTAVQLLIDEGSLRRLGRGRLAVDASRAAKVRSEIEGQRAGLLCRPQDFDDYFETIASDLVRRSFAGGEVDLRQEELATQYGVSARRVRDILHRLAGVGIVVYTPRRGWRLPSFKPAMLQAYIETRVVLELLALEQAAPHLVTADIERMLEDNRREMATDDGPTALADNALHRYLIEKSGNAFVANFFKNQGAYFDLLLTHESRHATARHTRQLAIAQHRKILEALRDHDLVLARRLLEQHIRMDHPAMALDGGPA